MKNNEKPVDTKPIQIEDEKKLKFLGTPGQFATLFYALHTKGWFDMPKSGLAVAGEWLKLVEFKDYTPTPDSLARPFNKLDKDKML